MLCINCNSLFDKPDIYEQKSEFWGSVVSEKFDCCPYCGSTEIIYDDDLITCSCCGEYCKANFIETADGNYFCEECYQIKNYK